MRCIGSKLENVRVAGQPGINGISLWGLCGGNRFLDKMITERPNKLIRYPKAEVHNL